MRIARGWRAEARGHRGQKLFWVVVAVLFCGGFVLSSWAQERPPEGQGETPPPNFRALPDLNPVQEAMAVGTDAFCDAPAGAGTDLNRSLCGGGFRGGVQSGTTDAETARLGLQQLGYEEVTSQGTTAVEVSQAQFANIGARLAALRGGATSLGLRKFTLRPRDQRLPGTLVASLAPYAALASATPTSSLFKRFGLFLTGTLSIGDKDATSREAGFDFDTLGVTGGIDYRFTPALVLGLAAGYVTTDVDLDAAAGGLDVNGWSVSAYGTYQGPAALYIDGIVTVGWNDYDSTREIDYTFTDSTGALRRVDQTALGETEGVWYALSVTVGYDFQRRALTFGPLVRVHYTRVDIDGFEETIVFNPGNTETAQNLSIASQELESLITVVGAQAAYAISTGLGVFLPQIRAAWEHEFKDDGRLITARYVGDPGATQLRLPTDGPDRDFFNISASLTMTFAHGISAFVHYETVLGLANVTAHNVALGMRIEL